MADKTQKKLGFVATVKASFSRVNKFFRDSKSELKKVVWPSKADTKTNTIVVLAFVGVSAFFMISLDTLFGLLMGLLIGN